MGWDILLGVFVIGVMIGVAVFAFGMSETMLARLRPKGEGSQPYYASSDLRSIDAAYQRGQKWGHKVGRGWAGRVLLDFAETLPASSPSRVIVTDLSYVVTEGPRGASSD